MKKILIVFGTRPDAIKMIPLYLELIKHKEFEVKICSTGQHKEMLEQVLQIFNVKPDFDLQIMEKFQTLESITSKILTKMSTLFESYRPDIVLVHGDTTTGFASALSAFYKQIPVGHVEAGLRSYDKYSPFPEEMNRILIGNIADYHFAPTDNNAKNLIREGINENRIIKTGNTVIDVMKYTVEDNYIFSDNKLNEIDFKNNKIIMVTAHRRENIGSGLQNICRALDKITKTYNDVKIVYPVHLNPKVKNTVYEILGENKNVILINPLNVKDLHNLIYRSYLIATDSGGIQEEAPSLGKPVVVLRNETERPEAVEAGTVKLIGNQYNNIIKEICKLIDDNEEYDKMAKAVNPYGDGNASKYIANFLLNELKKEV